MLSNRPDRPAPPAAPSRAHARGRARSASAAALAGTVLAFAAPGQPGASGPPAALGGPAVREPAAPSLVERDFAGRVRRLDVPPEEAALRLLDLDAPTRERVLAVLAARARFLELLVAENIDLLTQLNTASAAGDRLDQFVLGLRLLDQLGPLRESGPLLGQIAPLLPAPEAARLRRLVREYWAGVVADEAAARGRPDPLGVVLGEGLRLFGEELGRAFQRSLESGDLLARVVLAGIDLTPAQRQRIDRVVFEFRARAGEGDAEKRFGALAVAVLAHLTPEQQRRVIERIKGL